MVWHGLGVDVDFGSMVHRTHFEGCSLASNHHNHPYGGKPQSTSVSMLHSLEKGILVVIENKVEEMQLV